MKFVQKEGFRLQSNFPVWVFLGSSVFDGLNDGGNHVD